MMKMLLMVVVVIAIGFVFVVVAAVVVVVDGGDRPKLLLWLKRVVGLPWWKKSPQLVHQSMW